MKKTKIIIIAVIILGFFSQTNAANQLQRDTMNNLTADDGKIIFKKNCAACHKIGSRLVGPDLIGVDQRHPVEWILSFIKSSQTLVKEGDSAAVATFNEFSQILMPDQPLADNEIMAILAYINREAEVATMEAKAAQELDEQSKAAESTGGLSAKPFPSFSNWITWMMMCGMTALLAVILILAKMIERLSKKM